MRRIPRTMTSLLSLFTDWLLARSQSLIIGPGLLLEEDGWTNRGDQHDLDPVRAVHLLSWQILTEALGHEPGEPLLLAPEDPHPDLDDDPVFVDRRLDISTGRWVIDVGGGALDELHTLGAGEDLWRVLEDAGASLWGVARQLRGWAMAEGIDSIPLPEETVVHPTHDIGARPAL